MRRLAMIVMTLAAGAAQIAVAHTELTKTVPADRAVVEKAPKEVELRFSEAARLTALSVQKDGAKKQSLGPLPADMAEHFAIALPTLDDGHYVVDWRALSDDGHIVTGQFMFAIGKGGTHDEHMNHDSEQAASGHAEHPSGDDHDDHGEAH